MPAPVGTSAGQAYKGREGVGFATVLPIADLGNKVLAQQQIKQQAKKPQFNKQKALKDIKDGAPEFWINHNKEISGEFNEMLNYAADIMDQGVNPLQATDDASTDWQQRWSKLESDGKQSLQLRKSFDAGKAIIDKAVNKDGSELTDGSIEKFYDYYGQGLRKIQETGELPPRLIRKDAPYEYNEMTQKSVTDFVASNPNYTQDQVKKQAKIALRDPSTMDHIKDVFEPIYDSLSKFRQIGVDDLANKAGFKDATEYLYYNDYKSQTS